MRGGGQGAEVQNRGNPNHIIERLTSPRGWWIWAPADVAGWTEPGACLKVLWHGWKGALGKCPLERGPLEDVLSVPGASAVNGAASIVSTAS